MTYSNPFSHRQLKHDHLNRETPRTFKKLKYWMYLCHWQRQTFHKWRLSFWDSFSFLYFETYLLVIYSLFNQCSSFQSGQFKRRCRFCLWRKNVIKLTLNTYKYNVKISRVHSTWLNNCSIESIIIKHMVAWLLRLKIDRYCLALHVTVFI